MDYSQLPFIYINDTVSDDTKEDYYKKYSTKLNARQRESALNTLRTFHQASFRITGRSFLMPEFIVSENAKTHLFYPQGFVIIDANKDYYTDRENLDSYELCYTLEGEGTLAYRGRTWNFKKGEGFFIDCRERHLYNTAGEHWKTTVFHFNGPMCANYFAQFSSGGQIKFTELYCPNYEMLQFQILKTTQKPVPYMEYKISCLFDVLLTELLTSASGSLLPGDSDFIRHVVDYIREHYNEAVTVDFLAHKFGISRTHLSREFKRCTGFPPSQYLIKTRLNQAKILLLKTRDSIETVGEAVGFSDTAHFIKMFRQQEGITPLAYRKNL